MSRGLEERRREKAAQCYPSRAVQNVSRGLVAAGMEEKETYRKAETGTRTLESIKVLLRPEQSQIAFLRHVTLISY